MLIQKAFFFWSLSKLFFFLIVIELQKYLPAFLHVVRAVQKAYLILVNPYILLYLTIHICLNE